VYIRRKERGKKKKKIELIEKRKEKETE